GLLADRDRRSPVLPAVRMLAQIKGGPEQSDDDNRQWHPIHIYKSIDTKIVFLELKDLPSHAHYSNEATYTFNRGWPSSCTLHVQERTDRLQENENGKRELQRICAGQGRPGESLDQ